MFQTSRRGMIRSIGISPSLGIGVTSTSLTGRNNKDKLELIANDSTSPPAVYEDNIIYGSEESIKSRNLKTGELEWMASLDGGYVKQEPQFNSGRLYVSTFQDAYSLDPTSGRIIWNFSTGWGGNSKFGYGNDSIYFCHSNGYTNNTGAIYVLDEETGKSIWKRKLGHRTRSKPTIKDDQIIISNGLQSIKSFDINDGEELWGQTIPGHVSTHPIKFKENIIIASNNGVVYKLASSSGRVLSTSEIASPLPRSVPFESKNGVVFVTDRGPVRFQPANQETHWFRHIPPTTTQLIFRQNRVVAGTSQGQVLFASIGDGGRDEAIDVAEYFDVAPVNAGVVDLRSFNDGMIVTLQSGNIAIFKRGDI